MAGRTGKCRAWVTPLLALGFWLTPSIKAQTARNPHGPISIPCENCHTTTSFSPLRAQPEFDHNRTQFPLRGMHQNVACNSCHVTRVFTEAGTQCATCHADFHRRQFGAQCENCHTVQGWRVATRSVEDHLNRFPLLGAHAAVACDACHRGAATGVYTGLSTQCVSCHQAQFQQARSVDHRAAGFPTTCETCHNVNNWQLARFDHNQFAKFQLTGAHATVACASCHAGGHYQGTVATCAGCHAKDFAATTNPNHVTAGFPQTCETCHNTTQWLGATFDHSTTRFPLTGKHSTTTCAQCHANGQYATLPTTCVSCHLPDYQKTTTPNHVAASFPQTCETCHNTTQWLGATFDHNTTKFPLTGKHTTVACATCHTNGQYATLPTTCVSCHLPDYQKTTTPNHVAASFPQTCETCHSTTQWLGAVFDHNATKFPLTGKHTSVACATCHTNGQYATLPTTCVSCHLPDYQKTTTPNHVAASFPQTCETCHSTTQWLGAVFNHNATKFPLTGKHTTVACATCHANGQYATLPTTCVSCHLPDYPENHDSESRRCGFPANLRDLPQHDAVARRGIQPQHDQVPADRQAHDGCLRDVPHQRPVRDACRRPACRATCRIIQKTTTPNHVAAGFPQTCETCHSTTQWLGATFNHNTTKFPLTGKHTTVACATCHVNGQYATLPTTCVSCHLPDFQKTTSPESRRRWIPADVRDVPHHGAVAGGDVQSQHDEVPADRQAHDGRLRDVPRQRPVCDATDHLRLLPSAGLPEDHDSESRRCGFPANLRNVPHARRSGWGRRSITTRRSSR